MSKSIQIGHLALKRVCLKGQGPGLPYAVESFLKSSEGKQYIEAKEKAAFAKGQEAGLQEGLGQSSQDAQTLVCALQQLLEQWKGVQETLVRTLEPQLKDLAISAAEKLVAKELTSGTVDMLRLMDPVLARIPGITEVKIKLNPKDAQILENYMAEWKKNPDINEVLIQSDASVTPGGCLVETNVGKVDLSLETRMEHLRGLKEA